MTRKCGSCSLCCKLFYVAELKKPSDTWCSHCKPGKGGCMVYDQRPEPCREFTCAWLDGTEAPTHEWYPPLARMVLVFRDWGLLVTVDPDYPDAWRQTPYIEQLRMLNTPVRIRVGNRFIDPKTEREATLSQDWLERAEGEPPCGL